MTIELSSARYRPPPKKGRLDFLREPLDWKWRRVTASWRALPDFVIVGAGKAASTSLYDYLVEHPQIDRAFWKEVHFFDHYIEEGVNWYRAHFPFRFALKGGRITGEGTPYYCFHPRVAEEMAKLLPNAKLIFILRDPIARAYSHHQQNLRRGREDLSFEDAIAAEASRISGPDEALSQGKRLHDPYHQHLSYASRGRYMDQINHWLKFFPRDQILVLFTEDLKRDPQPVLDDALRFLGVSRFRIAKPKTSNSFAYDYDIEPSTYERLRAYYATSDVELERFVGRPIPWRRDGDASTQAAGG